jgi:MYXO-CTERM domain-containing protein
LALVSGFSELVSEGMVIGCPDPTGGCFPDRGDMDEWHLRTAMGITEDRNTLIFVVMTSSTSGEELAEIMVEVGAWQAFNVDGGGSSTLWLASSGYQHPTGTVRAVANHWGVFAGAASGQPQTPGSCHVLGGCFATPVTGAENEDFKDLPPGWVGHAEASVLLSEGITSGCAQTPVMMFCPRCPIQRGELAVFLVRAAGLDTSNPPATPTFGDVPTTHPQYAYIEAIATAGITSGCGSGNFCPDGTVTRAHAAAFMQRAAGWPLISPATPTFGDVPTSHTFYAEIETIADMCVTSGCGSGNYCPDDLMTRAMAAVFIVRTFDLQDGNPCFDPCHPETEICDGLDNNCDGQIDEGLTTQSCQRTNAWGTCHGQESCNGTAGWTGCTAAEPAEEICGDGLDNNCDNWIDEGCPGIDAGRIIDGAVPTDASPSGDASDSPGPVSGGCGCTAAAPPGSPMLLLLIGLGLWRLGRRKRRC